MTIQERIERDVARGDYGLARERLLSHLNSKGYDPELLAQLGELCFKMHDLAAAGKYWLASSAQGQNVDEAIQEFMRRCGRIPEHVSAQLPGFVQLTGLDGYPLIARDRINALGLAESILRRQQAGGRPRRPTSKFVEFIVVVVTIAVIAMGITSCLVGANEIQSWLRG